MRIVIVDAGVDRLLTTSNGPVARDLGRRVARVHVAAQRNADTLLNRSDRTGQHYHDSFVSGVLPGPVGQVGNTAAHAWFLEKGTKPHIIRATNAPYLVFRGRSGGLVRTKQVQHPGTRAYNVLGSALSAAR